MNEPVINGASSNWARLTSEPSSSDSTMLARGADRWNARIGLGIAQLLQWRTRIARPTKLRDRDANNFISIETRFIAKEARFYKQKSRDFP